MNAKIFWKEGCPNCPAAKELGKKLEEKIKVEYLNIEEVDGLAEASFHGVMSTPTLIVLDENEKVLKQWNGEVPKEEEIKELIK
ncbi:MAG: thioredoxin family protein [archaeon]|nr:thioredoxin family protein [Candidatus Micrarchaeota archaeon]